MLVKICVIWIFIKENYLEKIIDLLFNQSKKNLNRFHARNKFIIFHLKSAREKMEREKKVCFDTTSQRPRCCKTSNAAVCTQRRHIGFFCSLLERWFRLCLLLLLLLRLLTTLACLFARLLAYLYLFIYFSFSFTLNGVRTRSYWICFYWIFWIQIQKKINAINSSNFGNVWCEDDKMKIILLDIKRIERKKH